MSGEMKGQFLQLYAELEEGVRDLIAARCGDFCGLCTACCCRADICEEAIESPFLKSIHRRAVMDSDAYGFLDTAGCALKAGRPPVCYEFFCEEILAAQEDALHRDLLRVLGRLPSLVGEKALGEAHLVEMMDEERLDQVDYGTLVRRARRALDALDRIRRFYQTGSLDASSRELLACLAGFRDE